MFERSVGRARGTLSRVFPNRNAIPSFVAAVCLAAVSPAQAQTLSGRVLDPQDRPVASARLRLYSEGGGIDLRARSGPDGAYRLGPVAPGGYLLETRAPEAALSSSQRLQISSGEQTLDVRLELSGPQVEIIVTSSSTPLSLDETAKAIDVIDAAELDRRKEFSLAEALRAVPGVRIVQQTGPGGLASIQTRGMRSRDTAVLIDGLRFRDSTGIHGDATPLFADMMTADVERVEFLRGSGSSLYGTHAMAGALNVVSSQGGGKQHGEITAEGGGLGLLRGAARFGGGLAQDRFVYSGGASHLNVTQGLRGSSPYRNSTGHGFAKYRLTPKTSLSGRLWASDAFLATLSSPEFPSEVLANFPESGPVRMVALADSQLGRFEQGLPIQAGAATFVPAFDNPDSRRTGRFLNGAAILQHQFSPGASARVSYQGVDSKRSFWNGPAGAGAFQPTFSQANFFEGRVDLLQARTDLQAGGRQLVTLGYEFERESFLTFDRNENPDPALRMGASSDITQGGHSLFAQDQIRLFDGRLQLGLSGRLQTFNLNQPVFTGPGNPYVGAEVTAPPRALTGDVSAAYFFSSTQTKLRAHVGNAYRAPSSFERFGASFFAGQGAFYGDPWIGPERMTAYDGGVDQWLWGSRARVSATIFHTDLRESILFDFGVIDPATDPFGRFGGYRNAGGGWARGAEFSAQASPAAGFTMMGSYTYLDTRMRTPTIGQDFFGRPLVSNHLFTFVSTQRLGRRADVTFDLFAASDYSAALFGAGGRRLIFDGPMKSDAVVRYWIMTGDSARIEFYGKLENVFNQRWHENGFGVPGLWGLGGLRLSF